jgi:hypothetical protein
MLTIRPLIESDYDVLCKWWKDWGWNPIPKGFLPQNGEGGLMVMEDETPIVAGFLFVTNSEVAWLEFIISNKNYTNKEIRKKSINLLIETLTNMAKQNGFKYIYTILKNDSLIKAYETVGYVKGSTGTEMIKTL